MLSGGSEEVRGHLDRHSGGASAPDRATVRQEGVSLSRLGVCPAACLYWHTPVGMPASPSPQSSPCPHTEVCAFPPAGVITAMAFVLVGLLLLMLHYMYRHKGTYHTNEAKGTEFAESADVALQDDPSLQDNGGSSKKEYFI